MNLRTLLALDAATCVVTGLLLLGLPGTVGDFTGLPPTLLIAGGAALLPIAVLMAALSRSTPPHTLGLVVVIALNLTWVIGCLAAIVFATPSSFGVAFVAVQAIAVTGFTWAEWRLGIGRPSSAV